MTSDTAVATAMRPRARAARMLTVILSVVVVLPLSVAGTSVVLPAVATDLGAEPVPLQWVVNGFNVAFAVSTLCWGSIADRVGLRRTFLINAGVLAAASIASTMAPSLIALDVFRVVAGAGAGAVQVSAAALISTTLHGAARARAFGMLGTALGTGLAFGPTISGLVSSLLGWRSVFVLPLVPLALAFILRRNLPLDTRSSGAARSTGWSEADGDVKWHALRQPRFLAFCVVTIAQAVGFITLLTYLPTVFSAVWGFNEGEAGTFMLVMTGSVLLLPLLAARCVVRFAKASVTRVILVALACGVVGNALMVFAVVSRGPLIPVMIAMVLLGSFFGLPLGLLDGEALASAPQSQQGRASGILNFARISSEAVAVAVYGMALGAAVRAVAGNDAAASRVITGSPERPDWFAAAFQTLQYGVLGSVTALSLCVVALFLLSARRR